MNTYIEEYPRPQLVRKRWTNLNGIWDFQFDDENKGECSWEYTEDLCLNRDYEELNKED